MAAEGESEVLIVGGGVIGCCIAYYLNKKNIKATIVEACDIAAAASGKAGGFLALDWCDGLSIETLAKHSFQLHRELAEQHGNPWQYRRLDTISVCIDSKGSKVADVPWLDGARHGHASVMGTVETTAQVTPVLFTRGMFELSGARLVRDHVLDLIVESGRVCGVRLQSGQDLRADKTVLAMGPWSTLAQQWLPQLPTVSGTKAHSIIADATNKDISAHAIFIDYEHKGKMENPEIYPRPDGTVYVCGMSSTAAALPPRATDVTPTQGACETLQTILAQSSSHLADTEIVTKQACFLPQSPDGVPLLGHVPGAAGAYFASGHGCWGILNAPATGELMAEIISDEGYVTPPDLEQLLLTRMTVN